MRRRACGTARRLARVYDDGWSRFAIPAAVRARDLVGYGRTPPPFRWPDDARVVVNLVLVYEEGSEYSVLWGDDRNDGWGEYAGARRAAAAARPRHRVALRVRQPRRRLAAGAHLRRRRRAGHGLGGRRRARAEPGGRRPGCASATTTCSATAGAGSSPGRDARRGARADRPRVETYERVLGSRPLGWNSPQLAEREHAPSCCARRAASSTTPTATRTTCRTTSRSTARRCWSCPYSKTYNDSRFLTNPGFASPRDFLDTLDDGARRAAARGRRAAHDDDGRRARALERPGRARGGAARSSSSTRRRSPGCGFMRRARHRALVARAVPPA